MKKGKCKFNATNCTYINNQKLTLKADKRTGRERQMNKYIGGQMGLEGLMDRRRELNSGEENEGEWKTVLEGLMDGRRK